LRKDRDNLETNKALNLSKTPVHMDMAM